jgi:AcrR family transcriptional regulator
MATAPSQPPAGSARPRSRVERRKAQTRHKLIAAARVMLADDTAAQSSIQEITDTADVGFGSFYNHFSSKAELFEAAVADVLEELGELLDQLSVDVDDPALAFARSVRLVLRLCRNRPEMAAVLIRHGMHYMESPGAWPPARCATSRPASSPLPTHRAPPGPRRRRRSPARHPATGTHRPRPGRRRRPRPPRRTDPPHARHALRRGARPRPRPLPVAELPEPR